MRYFASLFLLLLMGCNALGPISTPIEQPTAPAVGASDAEPSLAQFEKVIVTMEPVVEQSCRQRVPSANCDFLIVVDNRVGLKPNAYQYINDDGRPVLGFTLSLVRDVRNIDELAFVLGHEAAHHILQHLARQHETAQAGALILGTIAARVGASASAVAEAQKLGASVGARTYSKDFELEADFLGARLTRAAGYDALRGAAYFTRIPDPGNKVLGTHPPNAQRLDTVREALR